MTDALLTAIVAASAVVLSTIVPAFIGRVNSKKLDELKTNTETNHGLRLGQHVEAISEQVNHIEKQLSSLWTLMDSVGPSRFAAYLDLAPEAVFITDAQGNIMTANYQARHLFGLSLQDLIDGKWASVIHPDDREALESEVANYVAERRTMDMAYRIIRNDGNMIKVHGRARPIYSHNGEITGYIGVVQEI